MVCKEDVFLWFKDLNGSRRIDFVCGLLNMCVPFELRYFGTCVEDLCKKDFQYLRDAENRANNIQEISKFENLTDDITRSKLIVSLALLQSSNHVCSNIIFKILTDSENMDNLLRISVYQKIVDEIFLLFTMALNHPAFTFDQKSSLGSQLKVIEKVFNGYELEPHKESPFKWRIEQDLAKSNPSHCTVLCSSGAPQKFLIKNLEVKNKQRKKGDKHNDYRLKVYWINGEVTEVIKTNQEMKELVSKLNQFRLQALHEQSQGLNIPNVSCVQNVGHIEDNEDGVSCQYLNQMFKKASSSLPEYELLLTFIQGISHQTSISQHCLSPSVNSETLSSQSVISSQANPPPLFISNTVIPVPVCSGPTSRIVTDGHKGKAHTTVPGHANNIGLQGNSNIGNSNPVFQIPTSCTSPVTSSSPLTSPLSSPYASPSQSGTSSRSASPWTHPATADMNSESNLLQQLFKKEKLRKYWEKLQCYSADELRSLSDEDLIKEGLTMGAISRFRKMLENFRNRTLNGLNIHPLDANAAASVVMTPVTCTVTTSVVSFPVSMIATVSQALVTTAAGNGSRTTAHIHSYPPISHFHTQSQNSISNSTVGITTNTTTGCTVNLHSRQPLVQSPPSVQRLPTAELQSQPYQQFQHLSQQTPVNGDSSPTCSEYSSPPCSPSLDIQSNTNNFDSSCSDENEKDKEIEKPRILDRPCVQHKYGRVKERSKTCDIISKSGKMAARLRITDESHIVPPASVATSIKPNDVNSKSIRPDVLPVSLPGNSAAVNAATFPRSRGNTTVSSNAPTNTVHAFKTGSVNATAASPVRNSNSGTIIFENSQFGKTLSVNSSNPPTGNRWELINGSCPPLNNQNSQVPVSNVVVTPCTLSQKESMPSRTSNSVVTTTTIISTVTQNSQVSSVNMLNVRHNKTVSNQHTDDHKINNSNHPPNVTSATTCIPCVGPGTDTNHPNTHYTPTPISYPSLPSTPVAPTTVTYATPAFIPLVTGQTSSNPSTGPAPQTQVPHNHGVTAVVSTGCSNACVCSCSCTTQPGNLAYSPGFLPLHMSSTMFPGFHGFLQPHSTNGFISPSLPNFSFTGSPLAAPGALPNGITPELMYQSTQYSLLQQNGSQHSSQATPGFITGPAPNIGFHGNYSNPANQQPVVKNKISCYNCGVMGHRGLECKESSMEEITKPGHFRLNYLPTPKPMENSE